MRKIKFLIVLIFAFCFLLIAQERKIGEINYYIGSAKVCRDIQGEIKCEFVKFGTNFFKGDSLITTDGRVEIDFGNNDFLRVDKNSEVYFGLENNNPNLDIKKGRICLTTVSKETYHLTLKGHKMEIFQPGKYSIDCGERVSISVIRGFAEVTFADGSFTTLNTGEMVEMKNDKVFRGFPATYNSFDRFVKKRENFLGIPAKERKEFFPYYPYWYCEPYWLWDWYYYHFYYPYPFAYTLYPFFHPFYLYYRAYPLYLPGLADSWRNILKKEDLTYKGGNPPQSSSIRNKRTLSSSNQSGTSYYRFSATSPLNYHGSYSPYHGALSKPNISSTPSSSFSHSPSSSSSSGSHSSGHARPKDK